MDPSLCIVVALDQTFAVRQDLVLAVGDRVRGQSALRLTQRHRTAGGVQPHPHLESGFDFVVELGSIGEKIQVVGGGCAPAESQLR